jgi:hypothetical protein
LALPLRVVADSLRDDALDASWTARFKDKSPAVFEQLLARAFAVTFHGEHGDRAKGAASDSLTMTSMQWTGENHIDAVCRGNAHGCPSCCAKTCAGFVPKDPDDTSDNQPPRLARHGATGWHRDICFEAGVASVSPDIKLNLS